MYVKNFFCKARFYKNNVDKNMTSFYNRDC